MISETAKQLMIDIGIRIPRSKIVYRGLDDSFYLLHSGIQKTPINTSDIVELINLKYLEKYSTGGVYISEDGAAFLETALDKKTKVNDHGRTEVYYELGAQYGTEQDLRTREES